MLALEVMGAGLDLCRAESRMTQSYSLPAPRVCLANPIACREAGNRAQESRKRQRARSYRRALWSQNITVGDLFLVGGLILLAAAALLCSLAGLIRHRVRLAGLVALLRWIRLILLCHSSSPLRQALHRAMSADRHSTG